MSLERDRPDGYMSQYVVPGRNMSLKRGRLAGDMSQ